MNTKFWLGNTRNQNDSVPLSTHGQSYHGPESLSEQKVKFAQHKENSLKYSMTFPIIYTRDMNSTRKIFLIAQGHLGQMMNENLNAGG